MKTIKAVVFGLCHQLLATLGVIIGTSVSFYSIKPILALLVSAESLRRDVALVLPLFPLQATVALSAGFALALKGSEFGRNVFARFVWIVPLLWLLLFFSVSRQSPFGESRWEQYFWSSSASSIKRQLVTTLPFITSVAYAFGSYLGSQNLTRFKDQSKGLSPNG